MSLTDRLLEAAATAGLVPLETAAELTGRTDWEVRQLVLDGQVPAVYVGAFEVDRDPEEPPRVEHLVRIEDVRQAPRRVRLVAV